MEIVRTEEGRYTRTITLKVDQDLVDTINKDLEAALVNGAKYIPLTLEEVWNIMLKSIDAPRFKEEYFVELDFYSGNMKLGDFIHCEINNIFATLPAHQEDETVELFEDEYHN